MVYKQNLGHNAFRKKRISRITDENAAFATLWLFVHKSFNVDEHFRKFTIEEYDFALMISKRKASVLSAQAADAFGLIQGALGRQGNPRIVEVLLQFWKSLCKGSLK